jgi:atypical dual specificity phosphatase
VLDGLGVSFGQRVVLDGITLSLLPNGIDVLMGPVKTGKSTLFRTLAGLYEGHALHKSWGSVQIYGQPLSPENRPSLVQQHAKILGQPLLQALLQPMREIEQRSTSEWQSAGLAWLNEYSLGDLIALADMPLLQCDNRVQRAVSILSHALTHPSLLLIDEPTFGLNDADAAWLIDWLKKLALRCKLCVSLHNQIQARRLADQITLIGGGRVLAQQNTTQFFQRPANEWVEQFIRTGSLSVPSPGVRRQDLADDVVAPPPLSTAAQAVVKEFVTTTARVEIPKQLEIDTKIVAASLAPETQLTTAEIKSPIAPVVVIPVPPSPPVIRKPADLPMPSKDGVLLASSVGEIIYRDSSTPRGFHWIVPGKLAGCPAPGVSAPIDYDMDLLARVGITRLVTLTETDLNQDTLARHHLSNVHLPIFDREAPSISQTHMLLIRMQRFLNAGEVLAVHCKAGLGRTGTILASWLIRDGGLTATESMARLRRIEPGFIQSADQEEFLHRYEADITQRLL